MKLESQVISLEIAKKLKELGVKQESHFYWSKAFDINDYFTGDEPVVEELRWLEYCEMEKAKICSAFTVAELGEMLPVYWQYSYQRTDGETIGYFDLEEIEKKKTFHWWGNETEADARGLMLIHLLENNLIDKNSL